MKIPVYNKGLGPSIKTPTGQLSPRASQQAFTQVGQAQASFFEKAGQIAFDFAKEQQRAETNRVQSEYVKELSEKQFEFVANNKDTDTTQFNASYDTFETNFTNQIDTRPDLNDAQKKYLKQALSPALSAGRTQGAKQAWAKGTNARTLANDEALASLGNQIAQHPLGSADRLRLTTQANTIIETSVADGLGIKFTKKSFEVGIKVQDYALDSSNSTNIQNIDNIKERLKKDPDIGFKTKQTLLSQMDSDQTKIRSDLYQEGVGMIQNSDLSFDNAQNAIESLGKGEKFRTVDEAGTVMEFDPTDLLPTQRGQLQAIIAGEKAKLEDISAQNVSNSIANSEDVFAAAVEAMSPEGLATSGMKPTKVEKIILSVAQDTSQAAIANIADGVLADEAEVQSILSGLNTAEQMIKHSFGESGNFLQRTGSVGDTANTIQQSIAKARKDLGKMVGASSVASGLNQSLLNGTFITVSNGLGVTEKQTKTSINETMTSLAGEGLFNDDQLNVAAQNNVTWDYWRDVLSGAAARIQNPDVDPETDTYISSAIELYREMDLRQGMANNHLDANAKKVFKSLEILEKTRGIDGAIATIRTQRDDINIDASYKEVQKKVEEVADTKSLTYSWYNYIPFLGKDNEFVPTNLAQIKTDISLLTKEYIKTGLSPELALEQAATEWGETNVRIRNIVIPRTKDLPVNIEELATSAVNYITSSETVEGGMGGSYANRQDALTAGIIPSGDSKLTELIREGDVDVNELSLFPIEGQTQNWMLVSNGTTPMSGENGKIVTMTLNQLQTIFNADQALQKEQARVDLNRQNYIDLNFKMGTGPFEGLTLQQKQTLKDKMENGPPLTINFDTIGKALTGTDSDGLLKKFIELRAFQ
jgi:hypothetical protein